MRVGLWRKLSAEELMLLNCGCWRRLLRVPWTAGRPNQSILKEISPGSSLEGMMLMLKLQYFGHLMRSVDSLEKTLMQGRLGPGEKGTTEDEMAGWHHWLNGRDFSELQDLVMDSASLVFGSSWGRIESDRTERLNCSRTRVSDWTELNTYKTLNHFHYYILTKCRNIPALGLPVITCELQEVYCFLMWTMITSKITHKLSFVFL